MPVARLDERQRRFVETCRLARLATVSQDGEPYLVPVCFAFDGVRFVTPIDEKPKRRDVPLRRVRNILETGRASLLFDHYEEDWSRLGWLLVRGAASLLDPDEPDHADYVGLLRARYPQYHTMRLEAAQLIIIEPEHVRSWGRLDPDRLNQDDRAL